MQVGVEGLRVQGWVPDVRVCVKVKFVRSVRHGVPTSDFDADFAASRYGSRLRRTITFLNSNSESRQN